MCLMCVCAHRNKLKTCFNLTPSRRQGPRPRPLAPGPAPAPSPPATFCGQIYESSISKFMADVLTLVSGRCTRWMSVG